VLTSLEDNLWFYLKLASQSEQEHKQVFAAHDLYSLRELVVKITDELKGLDYFVDLDFYTIDQSRFRYARVLMLIGEFSQALE